MAETKVTQLDENEQLPFLYAITSYGADYPVSVLVDRLDSETILIPEFQREYVWSIRDASRFIESLLLGLPVPGIFLSKEPETQKMLVIDGQQRLRSLQWFYDGVFFPTKRAFSLKNIESKFKGLTYKELPPEDKLRLDDSIVHATVIRQDEPTEDQSSIYHVFERLNTGGKLLRPQEIRSVIYHGSFSQLIANLNLLPGWREVFGARNKFLRDQELILRFLALFYAGHAYRSPMKGFLNAFMARHRHLDDLTAEDFTGKFARTIDVVADCLLEMRPFRPERALNAAIFDAVMVGIARRLQSSDEANCACVQAAYRELLANAEFLEAASRATANEVNLQKRLRMATEAFAAC